jgi:hypothetical protein
MGAKCRTCIYLLYLRHTELTVNGFRQSFEFMMELKRVSARVNKLLVSGRPEDYICKVALSLTFMVPCIKIQFL